LPEQVATTYFFTTEGFTYDNTLSLNYALPSGVSAMMWQTFIVKRFSAAAFLMEKVCVSVYFGSFYLCAVTNIK